MSCAVRNKAVMVVLFTILLSLAMVHSVVAASVTLAWDWAQVARTPTEFFMYKQSNCAGAFAKVGTIKWPTKQFIDATVATGGLYCWYVTAYDSLETEESVPSNTVRFQVPKEVLGMPLGLKVIVPQAAVKGMIKNKEKKE